MAPKWTHRLTITTPQDPTIDPTTGLETTPPPIVEADVRARLSQGPVANVGGQIELLATQNTTISLWTILVVPGTTMTDRSSAVDQKTGRKFKVEGDVADRPDYRPQFRAAAARLISDMQ